MYQTILQLEPYHFAQMKKLSETFFRFREKGQPHSFVREVSLDLLDPFKLEEILSNGAFAREWDEDGVRQILGSMKVENARVLLMANSHDPSVVPYGAQWESEKWYGTEFRVARLSDTFIDKVSYINYVNRERILIERCPRLTCLTRIWTSSCLSQIHMYHKIRLSTAAK